MNLNDLTDYKEAYIYAAEKHRFQTRKFTGDPYMTHPEFVACMLVRYTDDKNMIKAALLHDVVEDSPEDDAVLLNEIEELFGTRVSNLVFELTTDGKVKDKMGKKVYLSMKINNMSEDAFLIKLLDRLHNIMDCLHDNVTQDFREWYWKETHYILDNLERDLTQEQIGIINHIEFILSYMELVHLSKNA